MEIVDPVIDGEALKYPDDIESSKTKKSPAAYGDSHGRFPPEVEDAASGGYAEYFETNTDFIS